MVFLGPPGGYIKSLRVCSRSRSQMCYIITIIGSCGVFFVLFILAQLIFKGFTMKAPWDSPEMLLYSCQIPVADPGEVPGGARPPPPPYFKSKLRLLIHAPKLAARQQVKSMISNTKQGAKWYFFEFTISLVLKTHISGYMGIQWNLINTTPVEQ